MTGTDVHGFTLADYPEEVGDAKLLGINGEGYAEYLEDDHVITARFDPEGSLKFPAPEYGLAHELSLSEYEFDLATYLATTVEEKGKWRALTEFAEQQYRDTGG